MVMLHAAAGSYSDDDGDRDGDGGVSVHVPTTDFIDPTKKPRIKTTSVIPVLPVPTHPLSLSATTAALSSPTPRAVPLTSATEGRAVVTQQPTAPRLHHTQRRRQRGHCQRWRQDDSNHCSRWDGNADPCKRRRRHIKTTMNALTDVPMDTSFIEVHL